MQRRPSLNIPFIRGRSISNEANFFSDSPRLLRLRAVLEIIPISKSSWWAGVKSGRFPKPMKLGPKTTAWRADEIFALIEGGADDL